MTTTMSRREFIKLGVTGMFGAGMAINGIKPMRSISTANKTRPNVLLIVMDTVRADWTSLYGSPRNTTPNLQRIAREGLLFKEAISPSSWTLPSHSSMFTGRTPTELGVDWWTPLDSTYPTLAEAFRDADYLTSGFIANNLYCSYEFGLDRGFEHYEDYRKNFEEILLSSSMINRMVSVPRFYERYARHNNFGRKSAEQIKQDFLNWLDRQNSNQNFFTFLNFFDAHEPYLPPSQYVMQYAPDRPEGFVYHNTSDKIDQRTLTEIRDAYIGALSYIDNQIGSLIQELNNRSVLENTLVIITSDHGEQFGEHGLLDHGNSLYRTLIHVPMILYYPDRINPNQVSEKPIDMINVAATIIDLVGLNTPIDFPGQSILSNQSKGIDGEIIQSEYTHWRGLDDEIAPGKWESYIQDSWHYIHSPDGVEELYDYTIDPQEMTNLVNTKAGEELVLKFRTALESG